MDRKVTIASACAMSSNFLFEHVLNEEAESTDEEDDPIYFHINNVRKRVNGVQEVPSRIIGFLEITIANSSAIEFQSHFRITKVAFNWLLQRISSQLKSERAAGRQTIDPERQILSVLWLLATPDSYRSVGNRFNMGKSSLSVCFERVGKALNDISSEIITWPTNDRRQIIQDNFFRMARLQGVIGAIDGTYVKIKTPKLNPRAYTNRKCFSAVTLQAICDHSLRFIDCFAGYPSSVSDIRVFRNSDIYNAILSDTGNYFNRNQYLIGDKAYPVFNWCIPPFINRGNLTRWRQTFNTAQAQTRQVIERSFALLFGRFRRLRDLDMNRVDLIAPTILAACVLHNICLMHPDELINVYINEGQNAVLGDDVIPNDYVRGADMERNSGLDFREEIARNFM